MTFHLLRSTGKPAALGVAIVLGVAGCGAASRPAVRGLTAPRCGSSQLAARVGFIGAALGHEGVSVYLRNRSNSPCLLDGYPSLQMLAASGSPISTQTKTGPSYTIAPMKPERVLLLPRRWATFFIGVTDATGYGTDTCPTSTRVAIAAPGDATAITIAMHLSAYGGDVDHVRCGEVFVSPVIAGRHQRSEPESAHNSSGHH